MRVIHWVNIVGTGDAIVPYLLCLSLHHIPPLAHNMLGDGQDAWAQATEPLVVQIVANLHRFAGGGTNNGNGSMGCGANGGNSVYNFQHRP